MSARILSAVAFKVFAIYLCVQVILYVPGIWSLYSSLGQWGDSTEVSSFTPYLVASLFLLFGFAVVVILYKLGSSVLCSMPDEADKLNVDNMEVLLFQLLGLFFIVSAFTYLPVNIILVFFDDMYNPGGLGQVGKRFEIFSHIIELTIGLTMVIRAPVWRSLFRKLRYAGS